MTEASLRAELERLTTLASDILNSTNDRYRTGRADGILEAVESVERKLAATETECQELTAKVQAVAAMMSSGHGIFVNRHQVIRWAEELATLTQPGAAK